MSVARVLKMVGFSAVLLLGTRFLVMPAASLPIQEAAFVAKTVADAPQEPAAAFPESGEQPGAPTHADMQGAQRVLAALADTYDHLEGVTVEFGHTPHGEQAVAYYTSGRIVIGPERSASIEQILEHEIWHIIDWRDNGRLDWGEEVPPPNAQDYRTR